MAMNEMIVTNTSSPKIREWANDSNLSGRILISLIDDMLDLTKIEVGKIKLLDRPFNARHALCKVRSLYKMKQGTFPRFRNEPGTVPCFNFIGDRIYKL